MKVTKKDQPVVLNVEMTLEVFGDFLAMLHDVSTGPRFYAYVAEAFLGALEEED